MKPSYHLSSTPSADLYSTEFDQYDKRVEEVYSKVNDILKQVIGYEWTTRVVLENGVIMNSYIDGSDSKDIIINYTGTSMKKAKCIMVALTLLAMTTLLFTGCGKEEKYKIKNLSAEAEP